MRVLVSALVAALCFASGSAAKLSEEEYQSLFTTYITQHSKTYSTEEFFTRFNTFKSNLEIIRAHNAAESTFKMGINEFSDMTPAEFKATKFGYKYINNSVHRSKNEVDLSHVSPPSSIDWRNQNAVTPVKNQGQCGSCWAFSTTGSIEGAVAVAGKGLVSLSEQQLVDCSRSYGNLGCSGGLMDYGFQYAIDNKGLNKEEAYPYTGKNGLCNKNLESANKFSPIRSFVDVKSGDENALLNAVALGPVSVAIEADQLSFQSYKSGILSSGCGTNLDHGVLVVGYGTESNTDYWIVKNSWGATWGEKGYIRIIRGKNMCGIALQPSYPVV